MVVGGAEPASVIGRLGERVVSLHVKDGIDLPRSAYADEPFVNVPVGTGVVDPGPAIAAAEAQGSVEWLIVEFDHVEGSAITATRQSLANLTARGSHAAAPRDRGRPARARVGIVGCGDVTNLYLPGTRAVPVDRARGMHRPRRRPGRRRFRRAAGFPAVTLDELLADPTIEIVLVLTPPVAHAAVSRAAIAAGKHVYTEKPLATTRADAAAILADAATAGVRVGAAPDTFLGGGLQTARALIDEGAIGTPLAASASVAHLGPERWHPNPGIFYATGGGPLLDLGPYYVTALVSLLGPIAAVSAVGRGTGSEREIATGTRAGTKVTSEVPTTVIGTLSFESGVVGGLTASFDVVGSQGAIARDPRDGRIAEPRRPEQVRRRGSLPSPRRGRLGGRAAPVRRERRARDRPRRPHRRDPVGAATPGVRRARVPRPGRPARAGGRDVVASHEADR